MLLIYNMAVDVILRERKETIRRRKEKNTVVLGGLVWEVLLSVC